MKITDSKSLGQSIRARRKELGYTQKYLSEYTRLKYYFHFTVGAGKTDSRNRENNTAYSYPWNGSDG